MAFGPDSDGLVRYYRIYSRQTQGVPYSEGIHSISATADTIDAKLEDFLNRSIDGNWVRWFLLVADNGRGAFPFRVTERGGRWHAERV